MEHGTLLHTEEQQWRLGVENGQRRCSVGYPWATYFFIYHLNTVLLYFCNRSWPRGRNRFAVEHAASLIPRAPAVSLADKTKDKPTRQRR